MDPSPHDVIIIMRQYLEESNNEDDEDKIPVHGQPKKSRIIDSRNYPRQRSRSHQ